VLFARLEGEREAGTALHVDGAANDPARHLPDQRLPAGKETEVGASGTERNAERLALPAGDVRASTPLTRRPNSASAVGLRRQ
jgi:hypothetical protein